VSLNAPVYDSSELCLKEHLKFFVFTTILIERKSNFYWGNFCLYFLHFASRKVDSGLSRNLIIFAEMWVTSARSRKLCPVRWDSTVMDIDASTRAPRGPVASRDTALACLAQLGVQNGFDPTVAAARRGDILDGDTLPIARLVELAGEFKFQAEHSRVDWQGLLVIGFADPILALLKNTNVVILTGDGRDAAEEVAVWDPLHRDTEFLFVTRQEFERAWSGDVLKVRLQPSGTTSASPDIPEIIPEPLPDTGKHPLSQGGKQVPQVRRFCAAAVGIAATMGVGVGLFLFTNPAAENFMSTSTSVSGTPGRVTEATPPMADAALGRSAESANVMSTSAPPMPNLPESNTAATVAPPSDAPLPAEVTRLAALSPRPTSAGETRALERSPAAPMSVELTSSGVAASVPDATGSNSAPVIPPTDATLSAGEIAVLLTRGDKSLSSGDVASARLYYGRAVTAGDGQAALRLGETFDPVFLEHAHLRSARGDLAAALSWYRRARDMGAAEAEILLNSLEAK